MDFCGWCVSCGHPITDYIGPILMLCVMCVYVCVCADAEAALATGEHEEGYLRKWTGPAGCSWVNIWWGHRPTDHTGNYSGGIQECEHT